MDMNNNNIKDIWRIIYIKIMDILAGVIQPEGIHIITCFQEMIIQHIMINIEDDVLPIHIEERDEEEEEVEGEAEVEIMIDMMIEGEEGVDLVVEVEIEKKKIRYVRIFPMRQNQIGRKRKINM